MRRTRLGCVVLMVSVLVGCGGGDVGDTGEGAIKVGAIFDLTGPTSDVGTLFSEGIRDYVKWANQEGGIDGRPVELVYQDYQYKVDQAELLYSQFVQEGVVAFMGWGTGDTEALQGRVAEDKIPFASASFSHVLGDPSEAPYNFLLGTSYSDQLFIILDWIKENHVGDGAPSVALMHHPSPFGMSPYEQGGKDYADKLGIALVAHEMSAGTTDLTAELTNVRESGAGYVVFQNTSTPVALALRNAASMGYEPKFFCLNWCTNGVLTELAGEDAEGVYGSVLYSPPGEGVVGLDAADAFLRAQGSSMEEKGLLYGQGWWMMAVFIEGIRETVAAGEELSGENIRQALESIRDFDTGGVTQPISFSQTNHRAMRSMRIYEVRDGKWAPVSDFLSSAGNAD